MTKYDHWASEEAMKEMIDGWSTQMREQVFEELFLRIKREAQVAQPD